MGTVLVLEAVMVLVLETVMVLVLETVLVLVLETAWVGQLGKCRARQALASETDRAHLGCHQDEGPANK